MDPMGYEDQTNIFVFFKASPPVWNYPEIHKDQIEPSKTPLPWRNLAERPI